MGHRADLLAGAKQCLVEKGYAHTTARDIVAASGTNLASIGYHFGTKEALLNAAVIDSFNDWDDEVANTAKDAVGDDPTPVRRLEGFLTGLLNALAANRSMAVASVHAFAQFEYSDTLRDDLAGVYREARRELAAIVLDLAPEDVDDEAARTVGSLGVSLVNGLVLQSLINADEAPSAADIAAALHRVTE